MVRKNAAALALLSLVTAAQAAGPEDQLLTNVSRELPFYVQGVDPRDLRRSQLAAIYAIMHSSKSGGDKQAMIRSVIGGKFSLRGLLFR